MRRWKFSHAHNNGAKEIKLYFKARYKYRVAAEVQRISEQEILLNFIIPNLEKHGTDHLACRRLFYEY